MKNIDFFCNRTSQRESTPPDLAIKPIKSFLNANYLNFRNFWKQNSIHRAPVLSPLWKIIRIHTKYYALDHSMTYQCYLHEKHMFWLFCSDSFDGLSISGHGKSYPGKIVTIWYVNGQNSKNLSKSNFRICPWSTFWAQYWVTDLVGGLGCINKSFGTH